MLTMRDRAFLSQKSSKMARCLSASPIPLPSLDKAIAADFSPVTTSSAVRRNSSTSSSSSKESMVIKRAFFMRSILSRRLALGLLPPVTDESVSEESDETAAVFERVSVVFRTTELLRCIFRVHLFPFVSAPPEDSHAECDFSMIASIRSSAWRSSTRGDNGAAPPDRDSNADGLPKPLFNTLFRGLNIVGQFCNTGTLLRVLLLTRL
mmetsp:Transcript_22305/g.29456  ORF Transcript_22305/g.29456 Transcript_22305/m.29456 type:complete len:208 (+) Transcript_22305:673-1296(+)